MAVRMSRFRHTNVTSPCVTVQRSNAGLGNARILDDAPDYLHAAAARLNKPVLTDALTVSVIIDGRPLSFSFATASAPRRPHSR
jgi:hypothetical protein